MKIIVPSEIAATTHTPGPWEWIAGPHGIYLGTPDRGRLVVMDQVVGRFAQRVKAVPRFAVWEGRERERLGGWMVPATMEVLEVHPDARLIAAAPDLLEACKAALKCIAGLTPFNEELSEIADRADGIRDQIGTAIAKAER